MNYVTHLNYWFDLANSSKQIKRSHFCLYMGLFQLWNESRFSKEIKVNRRHLMELGKIGSKTTFSDCMKDLEKWGLIRYKPTFFSNISSEVEMFHLTVKKYIDHNGFCVEMIKSGTGSSPKPGPNSGTGTCPEPSTESGTASVPKMGHLYKTNQTFKQNNKRTDFNDLKNKYFNPL